MTYTLDQLSTMMTALQGRVNALDGQNLPVVTQGVSPGLVPDLQRQVNGCRTELKQVTGSLQTALNTLSTQTSALMAAIRSALGLSM